MELKLTVTVFLLCCTRIVYSDGQCSTYGQVHIANDHCRGYMHNSKRIGRYYFNSTTLLKLLKDDCSLVNDYYNCMNGATYGCNLGKELAEEVKYSTNYCKGNDVADWVKDLAPAFDNFNGECVFTSAHRVNCREMDTRFSDLFPFENITLTTEEGLQEIRELQSGWMNCILQTLRDGYGDDSSTCGGRDLVDSYITYIVATFGLSGDRPLGVYLNTKNIKALRDLVPGYQTRNVLRNFYATLTRNEFYSK